MNTKCMIASKSSYLSGSFFFLNEFPIDGVCPDLYV